MKLAGAVLIIIATTLYGFEMGNDIKRRVKGLLEWKKMLVLLEGELKYNNTIIHEAIRKIGNRSESIFSEVFITVNEKMLAEKTKDFSQIWKETVDEKLVGNYGLKEKDTEKIKEFGSSISNVDMKSMEKIFEGYVKEIEFDIEEINQDKDNKTRMYRALGVMSGLFVAVLIV